MNVAQHLSNRAYIPFLPSLRVQTSMKWEYFVKKEAKLADNAQVRAVEVVVSDYVNLSDRFYQQACSSMFVYLECIFIIYHVITKLSPLNIFDS
jgi:hypothetical protein